MMAKITVETDTEALLASIADWDGAAPPFGEIVCSALAQAAMMGKSEEFRKSLAASIECPASTVSRWASGASRPMGGVQKLVVREIATLLRATRDAYVAEHRAAHAAFRRLSLDLQAAGGDDDDGPDSPPDGNPPSGDKP